MHDGGRWLVSFDAGLCPTVGGCRRPMMDGRGHAGGTPSPRPLRPKAGSVSRRGQELSVDSVHGHVPECAGRRPGSHSAASPRTVDEVQRSSRLATTSVCSVRVVGWLIPQPVGHAIHNPDEIARKAIQRDFVPVGTHPAPQFRFCSQLQDHVNHSARIVPWHDKADVLRSDPGRSRAAMAS